MLQKVNDAVDFIQSKYRTKTCRRDSFGKRAGKFHGANKH